MLDRGGASRVNDGGSGGSGGVSLTNTSSKRTGDAKKEKQLWRGDSHLQI